MLARRSLLLVASSPILGALLVINACGDDDGGASATSDGGAETGNVSDTGAPDVATSNDGGTPPGARYKSGSRLRAQLLIGAGSDTGRFEAFFDTLKNEECDWVDTSATDALCIPKKHTFAVFGDDTCTTPIAITDDCTDAFPLAAVIDEAVTCDAYTDTLKELRPIGALLTATVYYRKDATSGGCVPEAAPSYTKLHSLGAPVALTEYVAGKKVLENPAPGLRRSRIVGADGSELALPTLFDVARDAGCYGGRLVAPRTPLSYPLDLQCIPQRLGNHDAISGPFKDMGCTTPLASPKRSACPHPDAILKTLPPDGGSNCGADYGQTLFETGQAVDAGFQSSAGTCSPSSLASDSTFFALGAEIAKSSLPAMVRKPLGNGRLRLLATLSGDAQLEHDGLWDDQAKSLCDPLPFSDGKQYCTTSSLRGGITVHYKDAACQQPIVVEQQCTPPRLILTGDVSCQGGAFDVNVKPLSAAPTVTAYYGDNAGCSAAATPLKPGEIAYDILPAVPVSSVLAEVNRVRE